VVEDLGSKNGIVVADRQLAAGAVAELRVGDSFRIGPFTVLVAEAAPPETWGTQAKIQVLDPTPRGLPSAVARLAESAVSIVIEGETGSGKEVLARSIHELSRRTGPFVGLNVPALSDGLLESELFGHERGAFTGAVRAKLGLLETAKDGTVFLDEIGEMPLGLQAKLLRAIETREIYRVGAVKPIALSVRFLAATHRNLEAEVAAGRFRRDLLYRLDGITLQIPPLRERRGAIADLAATFLAEASAAAGRSIPRIGVDAIAKLVRYRWPGNVRELRAVIARSLLLCDGDELRASAILVDAMVPPDSPGAFVELARRHRGNVTEIARVLATSRSQVHRLAQRFGIALDQLRELRPT
jgi:DNA-binding NtrC family response regulator